MSQRETSLYDVIGVSPHATQEEIEAACLRLAERYRPDRNPNDTIAAANFAAVEKAFETLGSPEKRREYDERTAAVRAGEPIVLKHSIVGYLGAVIGGLIMLLAFYSKPSEPGGTAMLVGGVIAMLSLSIAIRAVPVQPGDLARATSAAKSTNNTIRSAIASMLGIIVGTYFLLFWPGMRSTIQVPERSANAHSDASRLPRIEVRQESVRAKLFEIRAIGYLDSILEIEGCRRESERIAKCIVQAKSRVNMLDGRRISAAASRWDSGRADFVDLPQAVVNAGLIGSGPSEITILMPEGANLVHLSFR